MTRQTDIILASGCKLRVERAQLRHFPEVALLFEKLHTYNATLNPAFALAPQWREVLHAHFARTWDVPAACWLLAWVDEQPCALLILEVHTDSPLFLHRHRVELVALYVEPEFRGMDVASELMKAGSTWAADQGIASMQLYVTSQNERARAFYQRCGWRPVQEIWHYDVLPHTSGETVAVDPSCVHESDVLESGHHHMAARH